MNAPNPMSLDEVITALRTVKAEKRATPSVSQLRRLIDDVTDLVPLEQIVIGPELSSFEPADILSFAEEFGKHRARVLKRKLPKGPVITAAETGALPGMEFSTLEIRKLAEARSRAKARGTTGKSGKANARDRRATVNQFPNDLLEAEGPTVVLPPGFEKGAGHGRDVKASIRALAVTEVEESEIIRFAERHFAERTTMLDVDHVHLLHWVASHGLAEKLLELGGLRVTYVDGERQLENHGGSNTSLVKLLIEAYDLLEVARADAMSALGVLVRGDVEDIDELRDAARKARWLAPGEIMRLEKLMDQVERNRENERLTLILQQRRRSFAQWVRANPSTFAVTGVERLTSAHLAQILEASGLVADESEEKAIIAELRNRLTDMGLANDLDREIPEGLRAYKLGKLEEFYASRQARAEGDPDWKLLFEAATADELMTV